MDAWLIWLIVGVAAAVGELVTGGLFLAPFAVGAFGAMGAALAGIGAAFEVLAFAVLSMGSFGLLRPIARRHQNMPPHFRTNTAALVGTTATVVDRIANSENVGSVRIGGEVWTARAYQDEHVLESGAKVQVVEIRGATALVIP
jgi:membrane protein implicated in regulation of membrane protease activity